MAKPRQKARHWREVTGPWRRIRDGLFQTTDGRFRGLWSEELSAWWLIERTPEGEHWQDTFRRLVDLRQHVAGVLEAEDAHADAYMLRHRETATHQLVEVVHGGQVYATVSVNQDDATIRPTLSRQAFGPELALNPEFTEAFSLALAEAAMTARALEAQRGGTT